MKNAQLTGIERSLVLEYLLEGNAGLEAFEENSGRLLQKLEIESKEKQLSFVKKNLLLLKKQVMNPQILNKPVAIRFYFNELGLCFNSKIVISGNVLFLQFPEIIYKIDSEEKTGDENLQIKLSYDCSGKASEQSKVLDIYCRTDERFPLFYKPLLDEGNSQISQNIKFYVESSVKNLRLAGKNPGNGLFLIQIAKYLFSKEEDEVESIKNRVKAPSVIYLDAQRIVFAARKKDMPLTLDNEYEIELSFRLSGPISRRFVRLTCKVSDMYESFERDKICASGEIVSIKKEDERYLTEKLCF